MWAKLFCTWVAVLCKQGQFQSEISKYAVSKRDVRPEIITIIFLLDVEPPKIEKRVVQLRPYPSPVFLILFNIATRVPSLTYAQARTKTLAM